MRLLSRYLPRSSLCEIYKLHIRPHLDYGDVLYHIPTKVYEFRSTNTLPSIMKKIESVQYSAALAVTGAWKGTSRDRLYEELGWESLDSRRWTRWLTLFYKIVNKLTPAYMLHPIPPLQQAQYSLRRGDVMCGIILVLCQVILIFNIFLFKRCFDPLGFGGCSLSDQFKSLLPGV